MPGRKTMSLRAFRKSRAYRTGVLARRLHLGLSAVVDRRLQEEGLDLTRPQALALMALVEHPGLSNAELARRNGVAPQTMHQILARLERDGLAVRSPHPRLKRVQALMATPAALELVTRGSGAACAAIEGALSALAPAEQDQLIALLERCVALLPAAGPPQLDQA